jgi:methionyl-tRNA synthetase
MSEAAPPTNHYYITTPIYYVNDRPHIGHCYTTILADVAARFERLVRGEAFGAGRPDRAREVFFLTGTDEHAEKVVTTAADKGLTTMQWADRNSAAFKAVFEELNCTFDDFIRTTQERHKVKVGEYIRALEKAGDVYLGEYESWYDVNDEAYVPEARAKENNYLGSNGKPLVRRKEKNYFFKLTDYVEAVKSWILTGNEGKPAVEPEARRNEVLARIAEGLENVPISRPITDDPATQFGIRMPDDPTHRIYVWIDALFNYLSAVDSDAHPERKKFWPASVHVMGKEILWFHAVIWPALLTALGRPLPELVYAHSHYTRDGKKMSKSLGNFIDLETIRAYTARYGVDALRWYLTTQGPLHATDADFSHSKFVEVYNADLANGIGNCASRVANMIEKYFNGVVPDANGKHKYAIEEGGGFPQAIEPTPYEVEGELRVGLDWVTKIRRVVGHLVRLHGDFDPQEGLKAAVAFIREVDSFISSTSPFKLAKTIDTDPAAKAKLEAILYNCAEAIRIASLLMWPAIPTKIEQLWKTWNWAPPPGVPLAELAKFAHPEYGLKPGHKIAKGEALFMRADVAEPPPVPGPAPA